MPKKRRSLRATAEDYADFLARESDLEGLILRGHMLLERELVGLLAARLNTRREALPERITFELLSHLALSGELHKELRDLVLRFNKIRNRMAHDFRYGDMHRDTAEWAKCMEKINDWFEYAEETLERRLQESVARLCYEIVQVAIEILTAHKRGTIAQFEALELRLRTIGETEEEIQRLVAMTEASTDDD